MSSSKRKIIAYHKNNLNMSQFVLVPNLGKIVVPPSTVRTSFQYVVTQDETDTAFSDEDVKPLDKSSSPNTNLAPNKSPQLDMKSVSPTQLFNIQEHCNNDGIFPDSPVMLRRICESALLHESSKDVTLVSGSHDQIFLEEIPLKSFCESTEMTDLFVPISDPAIEQLSINSNKHQSSSKGLVVIPEPKIVLKEQNISCALSLCSIKNENNNENCPSSCDEEQVDDNAENRTIVLHLPQEDYASSNSQSTDYIKESEDDSLEKPSSNTNSKESLLPLILPTSDSVDVGLVPVLPIDSLLLGNFALMPSSSAAIKFQLIEEDGNACISHISVNQVSNLNELSLKSADKGSEKPYKCELCSATFNRLGNFTRHKKIHTASSKEDQRFHCEVCGKNFIQRCDLTRHRHIHSGTEPHRCSTCGKGYIRHSDLVIHQRFHNKEKPFACVHCSKGFSQRGDLNRHLRSIHLQVKPVSCCHCQKKFAKEATLVRHMQVTHRELLPAPQHSKQPASSKECLSVKCDSQTSSSSSNSDCGASPMEASIDS